MSLLSMLSTLDNLPYSGLPLSQEEEQWALKSAKGKLSLIFTIFSFKIDDLHLVRICLVAQKSEQCYSPVVR